MIDSSDWQLLRRKLTFSGSSGRDWSCIYLILTQASYTAISRQNWSSQANLKKESEVCACDRLSGSVGGTRLHFACYCANSGPKFTTVQTLVPNKCNMAAPYWDDGGFTFLQWKWVKVRRPFFFLQSMVWMQVLFWSFQCFCKKNGKKLTIIAW